MNVRKLVTDRLTAEFGPPVRERDKVWAWDARIDVGVVVDMKTSPSGEYAEVWLPHPGDGFAIPSNARVRHPVHRHSGTFASPGLRKGMAPLSFRIDSTAQFDELIGFIRELPPIRGLP